MKKVQYLMSTCQSINKKTCSRNYWNQLETFGFKYYLVDHKGLAPEIAILGCLSILWMVDSSLQEQN